MNERNASYTTHEVQEFLICSRIVAQTFKIKVLQPTSRTDNTERFPVLYVTDSDEFFGAYSDLAKILQGYGETPRFILVGVGYEEAGMASILRWRDLLSHSIRQNFQSVIEPLIGSPAFAHGVDLETVCRTTDAKDFLRFINEELMPSVNARYPTLPDDSSYAGYSAGATFGLYTLFAEQSTFRRYILGSPGTSANGCHFCIELAEAFIKSEQQMNAKVFVSVGELEEFQRGLDQFSFVSGYYRLMAVLKRSEIHGLDLTTRVFAGETHATAWALAFIHGLKAVFGPAGEVPYWPEHIKRHFRVQRRL
jgi:predicted alpha/beta superfamily hydrolase